MGNHLNMAFVVLVVVYIVHSTLACGGCGCSCDYKPKDCQDVMEATKVTGIYTIYPGLIKNGIKVRCDMQTAGGGWTVIQRRNNADSFYKKWLDYQSGFGSLSGSHWLGNLNIHELTNSSCQAGRYKLRIDMLFKNKKYWAEYDLFAIAGLADKFRLTVGKYVAGNAGDSLTPRNGRPFSTYDKDNDVHSGNCAQLYTGAWWYGKCHTSNLNGLYGSTVLGKGINWRKLTGYKASLQRVQMAIRRM